MSKIVPAIDEETALAGFGFDEVGRYDLEYRVRGWPRWRLGSGPLRIGQNGLPSRDSVERAKHLTTMFAQDDILHPVGKPAKVPDLEFRIVKKVFTVERTLVPESDLA